MSISFFLLSMSSASTLYISDIGVRGLARGGAFVAGANDISSSWYNPANFGRIKGGLFSIQTSGVKQFVSFDRREYPGEIFNAKGNEIENVTVSSQASPTYIPHLGGTFDFGTDNLTLFIGLTTPYGSKFEYPEAGPQRYSLQKSSVIQTFAGPSIAYNIHEWVSIGGSISWSTIHVHQSRNIAVYLTTLEEDAKDIESPKYDVGFELDVNQMNTFTWNLGLLIEPPNRGWAVGLSYTPAKRYIPTGTVSIDFSQNRLYENYGEDAIPIIQTERTQDESATLTIDMPAILRSGFLLRPTSNLEFEISFIYEGWGILEVLTVDDVRMEIETVQGQQIIKGPFPIPADYEDSWSVRFGGEWQHPTKTLAIRSGIMYETSGIPPEQLSVTLLDAPKYGYGIGGSYGLSKNIVLDVGWFQSFMGSWDNETSSISRLSLQIDPLSQEINEVYDRLVAQGSYQSSAFIFAGGLTYTLGQRK